MVAGVVVGDGWAVALGTVVAGSDDGGVGLAVVTVVDGPGGTVVASALARTADASDEQAVIRPADASNAMHNQRGVSNAADHISSLPVPCVQD